MLSTGRCLRVQAGLPAAPSELRHACACPTCAQTAGQLMLPMPALRPGAFKGASRNLFLLSSASHSEPGTRHAPSDAPPPAMDPRTKGRPATLRRAEHAKRALISFQRAYNACKSRQNSRRRAISAIIRGSAPPPYHPRPLPKRAWRQSLSLLKRKRLSATHVPMTV